MMPPLLADYLMQCLPFYRFVRRGYLCGVDRQTGKSYGHRRQWIEERIRILSSIFAIDICAYAVMSNHIHLVIQLNQEEITSISDNGIVDRWTSMFRGPLLIQKLQKGERLEKAELVNYTQPFTSSKNLGY
ncbi:hypothetical protein TDB9533_04748 [Thalassocella blandensis]|nr:hypothetical protein TDB9533_04748 [Thalassocella blandensis]